MTNDDFLDENEKTNRFYVRIDGYYNGFDSIFDPNYNPDDPECILGDDEDEEN